MDNPAGRVPRAAISRWRDRPPPATGHILCPSPAVMFQAMAKCDLVVNVHVAAIQEGAK